MDIANAGRIASRRAVLGAAPPLIAGAAFLARSARAADPDMSADDIALIRRVTGTTPMRSARMRLVMPPVFPNGYTVPLSLEVESPMTEADHVRLVHILAPSNPIVLVASFAFTPASGRARVTTRIRLSEPQGVLAAAQMSDGSTLMARTWVKVATDGCA